MNKYHAISTIVDGIRFDSKAEANRYGELKLMAKAKTIHSLRVHPKFDILVNGIKVGYYEGDFEYVENGERVVEDVKGFKLTDLYLFKKRCIDAQYGIKIREIY